ncbi:hypothetical protein SAMN05421780_10179 [Flexibacter flexilis DSM 6793]|uniref:Uncharacterized protein n=1 Tax=Flexibacter flexilis DSM 6793 TaxID=927664 RepID=A0A1I1DA86_9BACT|nr:hypothetical protein SAMN05421780_10179 [Flexibacter flexilis DSM 6793]
MFRQILRLFLKMFILATTICFVFIAILIVIISCKSNNDNQDEYRALAITLFILFALLYNLQILTIFFNCFKFVRDRKFLRFLSFYGLPICTYLWESLIRLSGYGRFEISEMVVMNILHIPVLVAITIGYKNFEKINKVGE